MTDSKPIMQTAERELAQKKCVPCEAGSQPIKGEQLQDMLERVAGWEAADEHHLTKTFKFPNFIEALEFVNRVAEVAEEEGHHPWIHFSWGKVMIELWTHKIDGLSENDFIMAAKIDELME